MNKIFRPCKHGGCTNLTTEGYCSKHKEDANKYRKNSYQRGYTKKWQKARADYLAAHPYCVECEKQGRRTLATDVDHIIPHRGDQKLFWDQSNWQSLCHSCHSIKTIKEENGGW